MTEVYTAQIEMENIDTGEIEIRGHGFHLGTNLRVAQQFCEEFHRQYRGISLRWKPKTVALKYGDTIINVYDGEWYRAAK